MSKHIGVQDFYALLRELNPHLPAPEHVGGEMTVHAGLDMVSYVSIDVFVELPKQITLEEVEIPDTRHDHRLCVWIKDEERYDCEVYA